MSTNHFDVLIIGAGISGIGAAAHLTQKHPGKSFAILEARAAIGGTWDLFSYPGIRSDSDLHTFCYEFKPWLEDRVIADASAILNYIHETASEYGVGEHIRFGHAARAARFSTQDARWTVDAQCGDEQLQFTANWLFCAGGYYRYDRGYTPEFPGVERFPGPLIHPQHWPEELDYDDKRVVVIGSGATAMTIIPAMAKRAAHVTMLQRTPSYVVSVPAVDPIAERLKRWLGPERAHRIARRKNIFLSRAIYKGSRRYPNQLRKLIRAGNVRSLPEGYDVDTHFNPPYNPWDQRLCLVPDGDFFRAIRAGSATVVTDQIETFTETGIELQSGAALEADIIITATGLDLLPLGGLAFSVDETPIDLHETVTYKGMMLSGVPNFVYAIGYTNASWTLKVDLVCEHFCRLLTLMDRRGYASGVPDAPPPGSPARPILDFGAGYVKRAIDRFPQQGATAPWELNMDYVRDRKVLLDGPIGDHMGFASRQASAPLAAAAVTA
ncbi:MAG TPA: NAD(P)/FAD-dependent oxidoreductase [Solirubrobacteraceae bacterium]|jgi:cation diffusion facilitator CzcD-associated flavoprotein CzcO